MTDFFKDECREKPRTDEKFGICDDGNQQKAYTDLSCPPQWVAEVSNQCKKQVDFYALDNCISFYKDDSISEKYKICDGMLVFNDSLYLVELKDSRTGSIPKAKEQLESTIENLKKSADLSRFRKKKAYICNRKHPNFRIIEHSEKQEFHSNTGFRLVINAKIVI